MKAFACAVLLALAGCGGGGTAPPMAERDAANALRVARADFQRHRYAQAAESYARALELAWRLDDPQRVATAGTERALALLRAGDAETARSEAQALDAQLERRSLAPPALLVLVRAAAALRTGRLDEARAQLARLEGETTDPLVRGRADYLRGRIAAARGDRAALIAAIGALPTGGLPSLVADRRELEARLALLDGAPAMALDTLLELERARRTQGDPSAVGETLELAGEAAAAVGDPTQAADLYLRAARNAVSIERRDLARARLERAAAAARAARAPELEEAVAELEARLAPTS